MNLFGVLTILLLAGVLVSGSNIQPIEAAERTYIRSNGSVDPSTAPILRNGNVYTFTGNIYGSLTVERNDVIIDGAGFLIQGSGIGSWTGMFLTGRSNVQIRNLTIGGFDVGIVLNSSVNSVITGSLLQSNEYGIQIDHSSNNTIFENQIQANEMYGILIKESFQNVVSRNSITGNYDGVWLDHSSNNTIHANNVTANYDNGVAFYYSSNNTIFQNDLVNNTRQIYSAGSTNLWDNNYPFGGNHWSNYTGADFYGGPFQNVTGHDGIGDTPHMIDVFNVDHYPLMSSSFGQQDYTAPIIIILSPENKTYSVNTIALNSTFSEYTSWIGYTLDGQANQTISHGRGLLSGLSEGTHTIIVYAKDISGNTGISMKVHFSVAVNQPDITIWIVGIILLVAAVTAPLVLFARARRKIR